jgi:ankyrin repeat protein
MEYANLQIMDFLIAAGEDVNAVSHLNENPENNREDLTALMLACMKSGNALAVIALLRHNMSVDLRDSRGWTALMHAAASNSTTSVTKVARTGCELDTASREGFTALMLAAQRGHVECFRSLVDARASIVAHVDAAGISAIQHAALSSHLESLVQNTALAMFDKLDYLPADLELRSDMEQLADDCMRMRGAAAYFDQNQNIHTRDKAKAGKDESIRLLHRLVELTEKYNLLSRHPRLIFPPLADVRSEPTSALRLAMKSLLRIIERFLRDFESFVAQEQPSLRLERPG